MADLSVCRRYHWSERLWVCSVTVSCQFRHNSVNKSLSFFPGLKGEPQLPGSPYVRSEQYFPQRITRNGSAYFGVLSTSSRVPAFLDSHGPIHPWKTIAYR